MSTVNKKNSNTLHSHSNVTHAHSENDPPMELDASPVEHSSEEVGELLGFSITQPLAASTIRRLRRPLPGYSSILKDAATLLARDGGALHVRGATKAAVTKVIAQQTRLADNEGILEVALQSVREQRMLVDDDGMGILRKINNAVATSADVEMQRRWKFLRTYLAAFAGGGNPGTAAVEPPAAQATAPAVDAVTPPAAKAD